MGTTKTYDCLNRLRSNSREADYTVNALNQYTEVTVPGAIDVPEGVSGTWEAADSP